MLIAVAAACLGGLLARKFKILPLIGYLVAGMFLGSFWPKTPEVVRLADLGLILLLFTLGLEFPLVKIARVLGGIWRATLLQAVGVIPLTFLFLCRPVFRPRRPVLLPSVFFVLLRH